MTTQAEIIVAPPSFRRRPAFFRFGDFPLIPTLILVGVAFAAIFANQLAPHNPEVGILTARFKPPFWLKGGSTDYLLGTDQLGRDVLSRLIFGARISLVVGFTAVIFAGAVGTVLGILSGYLGGWVDQVIMRVTDAWLALPALVFAIFLATMVGPSMWNIVIILGAVYWTRYARVIRGEVLSLREREFIKLAHRRGFNPTFVAISFVGASALARELGPDGKGVIVSPGGAAPVVRVASPAVSLPPIGSSAPSGLPPHCEVSPMTTGGSSPVGSVPGLKASKMMGLSPGSASRPVVALTRTSRMPGGTRNGIPGVFWSAAAMKSRNTGAATVAPCSRG